jgi:hypothetical protein
MEKIQNLTIKIPSDDIKNLKYPKIYIKKIADVQTKNQNFTWNDVNVNVNKNLCIQIINKAKTACIIM